MTEEEVRRENVRRVDRASDRHRWVLPLAAVFASIFLTVGMNIVYTTMAVHQDEQNWCEIVVGLDTRYQQLHSTDPAVIQFANQMHRLRAKLHC
jgi:hypothetical protein